MEKLKDAFHVITLQLAIDHLLYAYYTKQPCLQLPEAIVYSFLLGFNHFIVCVSFVSTFGPHTMEQNTKSLLIMWIFGIYHPFQSRYNPSNISLCH